MKIRQDLILRHIGNDHIIIDPGHDMIDMSKVITLNETAAWIWQQLEGVDFDENTIIDLLVGKYQVDASQVKKDVDELMQILIGQELIE